MTTLEEQIMAHLNDDYFKSRSDLRITKDHEIYYGGTLMGYVFWLYWDYAKDYVGHMILTLEDYKSSPSWKKYKKELAKAANNMDVRVVFVDALDIGFGITERQLTEDEICKNLCYVAKFSQDKDIKTAVCFEKGSQRYYAYNQKINNRFIHAEQVVLDMLEANENNDVYPFKGYIDECKVYSMLEPCYNCLSGIVDNGIKDITYYCFHKDKWSSHDYIQLTNDIYSKAIRNIHNYPIMYRYKNNNIIDKFYKIKESK